MLAHRLTSMGRGLCTVSSWQLSLRIPSCLHVLFEPEPKGWPNRGTFLGQRL